MWCRLEGVSDDRDHALLRPAIRWHNPSMSLAPVLATLETDRLILRHRREGEAAIYRQLWIERDPRVPPHRRISPEGRPTEADIAAQILAEREEPGPGTSSATSSVREATAALVRETASSMIGTGR